MKRYWSLANVALCLSLGADSLDEKTRSSVGPMIGVVVASCPIGTNLIPTPLDKKYLSPTSKLYSCMGDPTRGVDRFRIELPEGMSIRKGDDLERSNELEVLIISNDPLKIIYLFDANNHSYPSFEREGFKDGVSIWSPLAAVSAKVGLTFEYKPDPAEPNKARVHMIYKGPIPPGS